jgi:uncharacterized damage-inducible protein DinB
MSISSGIIPEFKHEMAGVRKTIALSPSDTRFDWRPHPKSMTLGALTGHLAGLPGFGTLALQGTELDLLAKGDWKALGAEPFTPATGLAVFDKNVAEVTAAIEATDDNSWMTPWTLKRGSHTIFTLPRIAVFRTSVISHMIHHRAQLGVYLRLLDIPIPGIYGPSADEM